MSNNRLIRDVSQALHDMLLDLATKYSGSDTNSVKIENHPRPDFFVYGTEQASIYVAGKSLRLRFKIHFFPGQVHSLITLGERNADQSLHLLRDFFKEMLNQIAGEISHHLDEWGEAAGISLPVCSRGIDELTSSDEVNDYSFSEYWLISENNWQFTLTAALEVFNMEFLKGRVYSRASDDFDVQLF